MVGRAVTELAPSRLARLANSADDVMSQSSASLPAEPARHLRRAFHGSADRSHRGTPELPARQDDPWSVTLSDARRRADQRATALTSVGPSRRAHTGAEPVYTALGRVAVGNLSVAVRADHCRPGGVSWSTGRAWHAVPGPVAARTPLLWHDDRGRTRRLPPILSVRTFSPHWSSAR